MNIKIVTLFITAIILTGCDVTQTHKFRSYITDYYDYANISLSITEECNIGLVGSGGGWLCGFESTGSEKKMYDSLCTLHNDMTYNKKREYIVDPGFGHNHKGDIISINIISNTDFDAQHPARTSLNDIASFLSVSVYPYIQSGYKKEYDWKKNTPQNFKKEKLLREMVQHAENECYHPINKKLSDMKPEDFILVDRNAYFLLGFLILEKQPEINKEHELTATITMSDGRVFTPTLTMVFN